MYSRFQLAQKFIRYYLSSSNGKGHGTHSPFIFHFIKKVLNDKSVYPAYEKVEQLRHQLLKDDTILEIQDFGAGSGINKTNQRSIHTIARNAAKPVKFGQLLYRMVQEYKPATILELGTSLGITTSYLSMGQPSANVVSLEGADAVAAKAIDNFKGLGLTNITVTKGNFDDTLTTVLKELAILDFVFIDGNHRKAPTEQYFHQLLGYTHNESILIFDDIHWSRGMEEAWEMIKQHESVRCTVDLFFIGLVFFRQEFKEKQHFSIRF